MVGKGMFGVRMLERVHWVLAHIHVVIDHGRAELVDEVHGVVKVEWHCQLAETRLGCLKRVGIGPDQQSGSGCM